MVIVNKRTHLFDFFLKLLQLVGDDFCCHFGRFLRVFGLLGNLLLLLDLSTKHRHLRQLALEVVLQPAVLLLQLAQSFLAFARAGRARRALWGSWRVSPRFVPVSNSRVGTSNGPLRLKDFSVVLNPLTGQSCLQLDPQRFANVNLLNPDKPS